MDRRRQTIDHHCNKCCTTPLPHTRTQILTLPLTAPRPHNRRAHSPPQSSRARDMMNGLRNEIIAAVQ